MKQVFIGDLKQLGIHKTTVDTSTFQDKRQYYSVVVNGVCWVIVCRNALTVEKIARQVVNAKIGQEKGVQGFVPEIFIGMDVGKITIMSINTSLAKANLTLIGVLEGGLNTYND